MKQNSRLQKIVDFLTTQAEMSVEQACELLDASPATIRRDFVALSNLGKAEKVWGGIARKEEKNKDVKPLFFRQTHFVEEKKAIARKAVELIQDDDVVMIDGGTTTMEMAGLLIGKRVRIITNSLLIANKIHLEQKGWQPTELFLAGGLLYPDSGLLVGPEAHKTISQYHADWAFISCAGIHDNGIYNNNQLVVETEKEMIRQSERSVVLADHSKFGTKSMTKICDFADINMIITDDQAQVPFASSIQEAGTELIRVKNALDGFSNSVNL